MHNDALYKKFILIVIFIGVGIAVVGGVSIIMNRNKAAGIQSFEECRDAGFPVMETHPEQCRAGGRTFINGVN